MKTLFIGVGIVFTFCFIIGALAEGWNFHVVFGSDKTALEFHKRNVKRIEDRLAESATKAD